MSTLGHIDEHIRAHGVDIICIITVYSLYNHRTITVQSQNDKGGHLRELRSGHRPDPSEGPPHPHLHIWAHLGTFGHISTSAQPGFKRLVELNEEFEDTLFKVGLDT
eukprot:1569752-Pyramimonas_sp.AAC.1